MHQMWVERNSLLQDTSTRDDFNGLAALEISITIVLEEAYETCRGVYNNYFQIRSQGVPTMTTDSKKVWLLLIRSAREAYVIHQLTSFPIVIYSEQDGLDPLGIAFYFLYTTIPLG